MGEMDVMMMREVLWWVLGIYSALMEGRGGGRSRGLERVGE